MRQDYVPARTLIPVSNKPDASVQDPRIARSTKALGDALIELLQERDFSRITVQHILDRAGVGRATFYAHYRNKEDVLDSSYDQLFSRLDEILGTAGHDGRLFPVAEFLKHVGSSQPLVGAAQRATGAPQLRELFAGYAQRMIERRLPDTDRTGQPISRPLAARMLAGALLQLVEWWHCHPHAATPADMDRAFHELAEGFTA